MLPLGQCNSIDDLLNRCYCTYSNVAIEIKNGMHLKTHIVSSLCIFLAPPLFSNVRDQFSCEEEHFSSLWMIHWMVRMFHVPSTCCLLVHPLSTCMKYESREERVLYPPIEISVELTTEGGSGIVEILPGAMSCSEVTVDDTNCTMYNSRDFVYNITLTQTNELGSTMRWLTVDSEYYYNSRDLDKHVLFW